MKPQRNAIQTSLIVALLIVAFAVLELFSHLPSTQASVALANTQTATATLTTISNKGTTQALQLHPLDQKISDSTSNCKSMYHDAATRC
jgi:hypothetical protein